MQYLAVPAAAIRDLGETANRSMSPRRNAGLRILLGSSATPVDAAGRDICIEGTASPTGADCPASMKADAFKRPEHSPRESAC
jgi:hypothetical protein